MVDTSGTSRREWLRRALRLGAGSLAAGLVAAPLPAAALEGMGGLLEPRFLNFYNTHTGERLPLLYAVSGRYVPDALSAASRLLRDHHDGSRHEIDPKLLDALFAIMKLVGHSHVIHVLSAYRSPRTNAMLRAFDEGVAINSFHLYGKAVDIFIPGVGLGDLHRAATMIKAGGVGFYPGNGFVHVDVGPVRYWGGGTSGGMAGGGGFSLPGVHAGQYVTLPSGQRMRLTPYQARMINMRRRAIALDRRLRGKRQ